MNTERTPQKRDPLQAVLLLVILGAAVVAVCSTAACGMPYRRQQTSADRAFRQAFSQLKERYSRVRVEELLGKSPQMATWPTPRPPVATNEDGSITVYSHIGPPPRKTRSIRGLER